MARQDYIPASDPEFQTWFQNYKAQVAALAATFGLTAGEVTAVETDFTSFQTKLNTLNTRKAEQQSAAGLARWRTASRPIPTSPPRWASN